MNRCWKLLLVFLVVTQCSCSNPSGTLIEGGYDEKEMDAAIACARNEVEFFIGALARGNGTDFAVKAPIEDKGEIEHFWLTGVVYRKGEFEGVIGNDPGIVGNVKFGQTWIIKKSEISDWMFMREGKMHGNYTMRPLLKTLSEEEASRYRAILANP